MSSARPAPVELVADGDTRFADEERALLHVRLRAVTFLLSAGLALVLVRDLTFGGGPAWPLQAAAIVAMAFLATLLSAARTGSVTRAQDDGGRGLRPGGGGRGGPPLARAALRRGPGRPHGARGGVEGRGHRHDDRDVHLRPAGPRPDGRAWRAIAAIAACPVATEALLFLAHPEVFRLARRVATGQRIGETLSLLTASALLAGYGAYLVRTMQRPGA